jgi:peroxiredoxin family protein
MSTDTGDTDERTDSDEPPRPNAEEMEALRARVEELEDELAAVETSTGDDSRSMVIIATKGTLDMAYPPLILASTAAAFGWDVTVFHTFWGLDILHEEKSDRLKLSAVGNPSMPVPNVIGALPGMDAMATAMMRRKIDANGTASVRELVELSIDSGVDLQACQMTMDLMEYDEEDFYEGVTAGVGAATALQHMADADIQLLV